MALSLGSHCRAESARSFSARPRKNRARKSGEEEISRPTRVVAGEGEGKKKGRGARRSEKGERGGARDATLF